MSLVADYPARLVCRLLDFPRCRLYRASAADTAADAPLREALQRLAGQWPTYGYRRLTALLRRDGQEVNGKRVRRLMTEMGIHGLLPVRRKRTTDSSHDFPRFPNLVEGLEVVRPDQVWVADITYIRLRRDFVYLAVIMDVFTRLIRGWHLGRDLGGALTVAALERALARHHPEIHHSDQGVQYAATDYVGRLRQVGASISMATVGKPEENGFAERLMRTIKTVKAKPTCLHTRCRDRYNRPDNRLSVGTSRIGQLVPRPVASNRRIRNMSRSQPDTVPPRA
jgi:putative transposase